ncbi:hypothetical protein FNV43_RR00839 [Rhamnella rubrinervis]|uniref:SANT domain-containing protein n=1 Tax=Rhamnella rubrinervis TaxID=2594499 RepID=A0A8K0HPW6_9ROSA|nr:hypothetical protein FNV43_RR00839 [Rhamnella rubrinervis]
MSNFLCKTLFLVRYTGSRTSSPTRYMDLCQKVNFLSYSSISSDEPAFAVSYFINSFGFSPQSAQSASRYVYFVNSKKPDSVVRLLKDHGFSQTQISNLVRRCPTVLLMDTEKNLLPKLEFFQAKGISSNDTAKMLSGFPYILKRSLTKQIIPSYDFFKNLFQSDEKVFIALRRFLGILQLDIQSNFAPNFEILREHGVPESNIVTLIGNQPRSLLKTPDRFRKIVEEVKEMGFDPLKSNFVVAVFALGTMTKSTWDRKVDIYKKWGWSEEEVLQAFRRHPGCMMSSENKITEIMDVLVNKMGLESSIVAKCPAVITFSLKRRIVPRASVIQFLLSKGLLKKGCSLSTYFVSPENLFLRKFVVPYDKESTELFKLYNEKMNLSQQQKTKKFRGYAPEFSCYTLCSSSSLSPPSSRGPVVTKIATCSVRVLLNCLVFSGQWLKTTTPFDWELVMAPSRKSRSVNKRFSHVNEVSSNKYGENVNKSGQKKRKVSDMLGPQWSKEELEHFYEAYRKFGKDWKKVATVVRNRSVEMVEALYAMNKAYLSLPEGTASVIGLIALMTDHYCVLGGSDSEQEINEGAGVSRKPQKRAWKKFQSSPSKGLDENFPVSQSLSAVSTNGCLSLLKKRRSGIIPHAVRKRTPRVPVSYSDKDNREKTISPAKLNLKHNLDATDDDVTHELAMALTEASQKGGLPRVCQMPNRKVGGSMPTLLRNGERICSESEKTKPCHGEFDKGSCELSLGSTEADNGDYDRGESYLMGCETVEFQQKGKRRYQVKNLEVRDSVNDLLDDLKEAGSGTEEQKLNAAKGKLQTEVLYGKSARPVVKGQRKRSKRTLFGRDEDSPFDALQTLADLSVMMPETTADTETSVQDKGENFDSINKSKLKGNHSVLGVEDIAFRPSKLAKSKEETQQFNAGIQKRKQKSLPFKIYKNEAQNDSHLSNNQKIEAMDQMKKSTSKGKRSSHSSPHLKQGKSFKPLELTSSSTNGKREENDSLSTIQVPSSNLNLPTKIRSRWKMDTQKPLTKKDTKISENVLDQPILPDPPFHNREPNPKERLSNCLSRNQAQRWSMFEWFYSAIDYPWFAKREFVEYLNHVGLGHVPRLTRVEWGVIRSSLGRPRRFSDNFLKEEKQKLNQYRESVRRHYSELRSGTREGLPTDLAWPLSVGQRVIAIHPRTRKIHDGSVRTVDHSGCYVQFDQTELGVEYVMDIDCMPLNPLDNMPASFMRQNFTVNKVFENLKEIKFNEQLKDGKTDDNVKIALSENLDNPDGRYYISPSTHDVCKLSKHSEGDSSSSDLEAKVHSETPKIREVANSQPSVLPLIQAKQADVKALSDLTRALDKKEAVVFELKCMNDEVLENQKNGDNCLKDSELFKKQYAAVLLQLNEVNEQVSSALFCLRQRNTYQGSSPNMLLTLPTTSLNDPGGHSSSCVCSSCHIYEPGSNVAEIVESSRTKAERMVDAAMQAISSLKRLEDKVRTIEDDIDSVNDWLLEDEFGMLALGSSTCTDLVLTSPDQQNAGTSKPLATGNPPDPNSTSPSNRNETKVPSELIAHCVATLLMIQKCTERQFPPADVARVLDYAVTSLRPFCSQNLSVYAEIRKCVGIIRNQILALIYLL